MKNVQMAVEGNILWNVSIPDREEKVGLNVYRKK